MSGRNSYAVLDASLALYAKNNCLASVHIVNFFARFKSIAEFIKTLETVCLSQILYPSGNLSFGFASVQKVLVSLAKIITFLEFVVGHKINTALFFVKKHFFQLLCLFAHKITSKMLSV